MSANGFISTASADMALRPSTAFQRFTSYSDHRKDQPLLFGDSGEFELMYDSTRECMVADGQGVPIDIRGLSMARDRWTIHESFAAAPQLSAVTQAPATDTYNTAAFLANQKANHYFEVLGTNAISTDVTAYAEGGIAVATHGATNDSTIILPHLTSGQSPWTTITWGTDQKTRYECVLQTPSAVTSLVIWAGLKLTNTPTLATDNDQAYIMLDTAAGADATKWHCIYSIGNVDVDAAAANSSVTIAAVAASTNYHLVIDIDGSRIPKFYINGVLAGTGTALTDATDLKPYIGIKDLSAGSARSMKVFKAQIARKPGV